MCTYIVRTKYVQRRATYNRIMSTTDKNPMPADKNEVHARFNMRLPVPLYDEIHRLTEASGTDASSFVRGMMRSCLVSGPAAQSRMLSGLPMDGKTVPPPTTDNKAIPQFIRAEDKAGFMRTFDSIYPKASYLDGATREELFAGMVEWQVIRCVDYTFASPGYCGKTPAGTSTITAGLIKDALLKFTARAALKPSMQ